MKEPAALPDCFYQETIRWARTQQELSEVTVCDGLCLFLTVTSPTWMPLPACHNQLTQDLQSHSTSTTEPTHS